MLVLLLHSASLVGALLLVLAGVAHVRRLGFFRAVVVSHDIVPYAWHRVVTLAVPAAEIGIGLGLVAAIVARQGFTSLVVPWLVLQAVLYGAFAAYLITLIRNGRRVACGCFAGEMVDPAGVSRACLLAATSIGSAAVAWPDATDEASPALLPMAGLVLALVIGWRVISSHRTARSPA